MSEAPSRRLRDWARRCGALGAGAAAVILLAWAFGLERLTALAPGWPPVMPNSALMLAACGAALALLDGELLGRAGRAAAGLLAAAAAALAAATAAEYALRLDLGIDQLLFSSGPLPAVAVAGRPSPFTAAAFLLLGAALLVLDRRSARGRGIARGLVLAGGSIAGVAVLGHLFAIGEPYGGASLLPHTEMAMLTAVALLALCAGALCVRPDEGIAAVLADRGAGGMAARRLLLGLLALVPLVVALGFSVRFGWMKPSTGSALGVFCALVEGSAFILLTARRLIDLEAVQKIHVKRLRDGEERYRGLVEQASDGIFIADLEGRYTDVNAAGCRMLGYSRDEIVGKTIMDLIPESDVPRLAQSKEALLGGRIQVAEWTLRRKDGSYLPVEVSAKIFPDGRWQGFVRDVTERRRAARLKDEVIALTSHELQNPLSTVHVAVRMLLSGDAGPLPKPAVELLALAEKGTRRMSGLIRDFLNSEKLDAGRLEFKKERVELDRLLQDAAASMELASGGGRRIALAAGALTVVSDHDRLMEVVVNLISNALKFSPPGGSVDVSAEKRGAFARVSVRDRGPGIPEEFRSRVFQRFARAAGTTAQGSGLGLSISKAIIEGLGGRIGFEAADGGGTTFYFELPLAGAVSDSALRGGGTNS